MYQKTNKINGSAIFLKFKIRSLLILKPKKIPSKTDTIVSHQEERARLPPKMLNIPIVKIGPINLDPGRNLATSFAPRSVRKTIIIKFITLSTSFII